MKLAIAVVCLVFSTGTGTASADQAGSSTAAAATALPATMDAGAIPAYQLVDEHLAIGGQPSLETLATLKSLGFKTVISLRSESEGPADEQLLVEKQGLKFVRVPVTVASFRSADADAVAAILDNPEQAPVLLHCGSSSRVGAVLAVLEARRGGSVEEAEQAGKRLGLSGAEILAATRKVIEGERK